MNKSKPTRFDLLDGFRGIAAIAVMVYHFSQQTGLNWMGGAWVSVDLFFILSGFVIAFSYTNKIINGMEFLSFFKIRLIRLGPLYIFGLSLGLISFILSKKLNNDNIFNEAIKLFIFGFFWIPIINDGPIFPLNNPAWSLFFELFINLIFFIYIKNKKNSPNIFIVIFSFLLYLSISLIFKKINPGWSAENFLFGFPRVLSEFLFGVFIYSSKLHEKIWKYKIINLMLIIPTVLFFVDDHQLSFISSIVFIPMAIVLASSIECTERVKNLCKIIGNLSYPIYVIHFPIFLILINFELFKNLNSIEKLFFSSVVCIFISIIIFKIDLKFRQKLTIKFT